MKTMFTIPFRQIALIALGLLLSISVTSSTAQSSITPTSIDSILSRLQQLEAAQQKTLESQKRTLDRLNKLKADADAIKVMVKRA